MSQLRLRPKSAIELLDLLCAIAKPVFGDKQVDISIDTSLPHTALQATHVAADLANAGPVKEFRALIDRFPELPCTSGALRLHGQGNRPGMNYSRKDILTAEFAFQHFDQALAIASYASLREHANIHTPAEATYDFLPEPQRQALKAQEAALQELTANVSRINTFLLEQDKRRAEHLDRLTEELEARYTKRTAEIESEYQQKHAAVERRADAIGKREAEVDARRSTIVRRENLKSLLRRLEDNAGITLSSSTQRKRWPIHLICLVVLASTGAAAYAFGGTVLSTDVLKWHQALPLTATSLVFITTLIYYLKWNDDWFSEHEHAELHNMQLHADISRANYIAELLFEWGEEKPGTTIPESLLTALTAGLFRRKNAKSSSHPADAVAELVRRLTRVSVQDSGIEFEKRPTNR